MPLIKPIMNDDALKNSREKSVPNIDIPDPDADINLYRWENRSTNSGRKEAIAASFELALQDNFIQSRLRSHELSNVEEDAEKRNEPFIDPDELNKKFPIMRSKFNEPMQMSVAQHLVNYATARKEYEDVMARAPDDFITKGAFFGSGIAAAATDPVAMLATMATGSAFGALAASKRFVTLAKAARALQRAKQFEKTGKIFSSGLLKASGATAVEGMFANALIEPATFLAKDQYLEDYTAANAFANVVVGGLAEGMIRFGGGAIHAALGKRPLAKSAAIHEARTQIDMGINAEPELHLARKIENETNVRAAATEELAIPVNHNYSYLRAKPTDINSKSFFITSDNGAIGAERSGVIGKDFGEAIYASDDGIKTNAVGASKLNESLHVLHEVSINTQKILDLEERLPSNIENNIKSDLSDIDVKSIDFSRPGKEILDDIKAVIARSDNPDGNMNKLMESIKKSDVEAMVYTHNKTEFNEPHDPHNVVVVLKDDVVSSKRSFQSSDKVALERLGESTQQRVQMNDTKYNMDSDPILDAQTQELYRELPEGVNTVVEARSELDNLINTEKERANLLPDGPEKEAILKELNEHQKTVKDVEEIVKANKLCRGSI